MCLAPSIGLSLSLALFLGCGDSANEESPDAATAAVDAAVAEADAMPAAPFAGPCTTTSDYENDGIFDDLSRFTYEQGRKVRLERDAGNDGSVNTVVTYSYDASGNLSVSQNDNDNDGEVDRISTRTYDSSNRVLMIDQTDAEGAPILRLTYEYFGGNDNYLEKTDLQGDGVVEIETLYTITNETTATGSKRTLQIDQSNDGSVDNTIVFHFDQGEHLVLEEWTPGGSDGVTFRETSTYDEVGNRLRDESDSGADGTVDQVTVYHYDCFAN